MKSQEIITYGFLSFDNDNINWIGRIWTTDDDDKLIVSFKGEDKTSIIEQAKKWAFENNYEIEW